ncbi:hypothetical protein [Bacillus sp. IBL03825]|nr:hypothetical protein [Bacillus sp. IBL03825]
MEIKTNRPTPRTVCEKMTQHYYNILLTVHKTSISGCLYEEEK